jgi:hypothetical protein
VRGAISNDRPYRDLIEPKHSPIPKVLQPTRITGCGDDPALNVGHVRQQGRSDMLALNDILIFRMAGVQ